MLLKRRASVTKLDGLRLEEGIPFWKSVDVFDNFASQRAGVQEFFAVWILTLECLNRDFLKMEHREPERTSKARWRWLAFVTQQEQVENTMS